MIIQGQLVDIRNRRIFPAKITVEGQHIQSIQEIDSAPDSYLMPGFVDAHIHIESSMLVPSEFARLAVPHGTVATVSDPHEIANVLGIEGVEYMIENGEKVPLKFFFGAPSCVPATTFETAGAEIDVEGIRQLLQRSDILYLAEMMNYPGVLHQQTDVIQKLAIAHELGKPVDGHAPGLRGEAAAQYIAAGISTDHECFTYEEALEKLQLGMKILIREGSAAKNFAALIPLMTNYADRLMFCSDDKHPNDLLVGHINALVQRAVGLGYDLFDVLQAACLNPVVHYQLPVGQLQVGDTADFIRVDRLDTFQVLETYVNGELVASQGQAHFDRQETTNLNRFATSKKQAVDFAVPAEGQNVRVIRALDGEIVTESFTHPAKVQEGLVQSDSENDILKIAVVNRYADALPAVAMIHGFGLTFGAIASCVGHDSHNIIAVGTSDDALCEAVNLIIEAEGGISAVKGEEKHVLPLPVAGIMTGADGFQVAEDYEQIDLFTKEKMNCTLSAPFMTLSFMALLVIPQLKLSDRGLFDGSKFQFTPLFVD